MTDTEKLPLRLRVIAHCRHQREASKAGIAPHARQPTPHPEPLLDDAWLLRRALLPQLVMHAHRTVPRVAAVKRKVENQRRRVLVAQLETLSVRERSVDEVVGSRVGPQQRLSITLSS